MELELVGDGVGVFFCQLIFPNIFSPTFSPLNPAGTQVIAEVVNLDTMCETLVQELNPKLVPSQMPGFRPQRQTLNKINFINNTNLYFT